MTTYQDHWKQGKAVKQGYRECADRYEVVREFCFATYGNRPFTVCDFGANMCYFGLRLTEDFLNCTVIAFEYDHFELRSAHVAKACIDPKRLLLVKQKLAVSDLTSLAAQYDFDLVLALSVMHHLGGSFDQWMEALRGLGRNIIAEFALDDSPRVATRRGYRVPDDAIVLGSGVSHLKQLRRPIVLLSGDVP